MRVTAACSSSQAEESQSEGDRHLQELEEKCPAKR